MALFWFQATANLKVEDVPITSRTSPVFQVIGTLKQLIPGSFVLVTATDGNEIEVIVAFVVDALDIPYAILAAEEMLDMALDMAKLSAGIKFEFSQLSKGAECRPVQVANRPDLEAVCIPRTTTD
jgi:hypothetical protein